MDRKMAEPQVAEENFSKEESDKQMAEFKSNFRQLQDRISHNVDGNHSSDADSKNHSQQWALILPA